MTSIKSSTVTDTGTLSSDGKDDEASARQQGEGFALAVVWASEPGRVGEVLLVPGQGRAIFGRGDGADDGEATLTRLTPIRQRPGQNDVRTAFGERALSRRQAIVHVDGDILRVVNEGRAPMVGPHGERAKEAILRPGETVAFGGKILLVCIRRPAKLPRAYSLDPAALPAFGESDAAAIVGESADVWNLRDSLAFLAARSAHVMLLGPSGSGKELAAQAIHALSGRRDRRLIARNAATFPTSLVEAELFGNAASYPNHTNF